MPPDLLTRHGALVGACFAVGYLVFMLANPARGSLRDGLRCLRRYPELWRVLALFGFSYALFQLAVGGLLSALLPEGAPGRPLFQLQRAWLFGPDAFLDALRGGVLPALELVAGLFNIVVTTFPISALAAALFLSNWENHRAVFARSLRRRFGGFGRFLHAATILCALAALVKPINYALLPALARTWSPELLLQSSLLVDWLSFLFESLFGVCVQIYLVLLVYMWVRGLNFTRAHLLDFAIRRFSNAIKWTLIIMALATVFIHLPLILSSLPISGEMLPTALVFQLIHDWVRPLLACILIMYSTLQIDLVFHGETLGQAFKNHVAFVSTHMGAVVSFLLAAVVNAWLLCALNALLLRALGANTAAGIAWQLLFPLLAAALGAWLLAAWACLYLRGQKHRDENEALVRF